MRAAARKLAAALTGALFMAGAADAKVIGMMVPAEPLSETRVARLPPSERAAWLAYLRRSRERMAADKAVLSAERRALATIPPPPRVGTPRSMPLDRPAAWYGGEEAGRIAENILSFQTPAGGWSKNQDRTAPPRLAGQSFVAGQDPRIARLPGAAEPARTYVGTIDNDATQTELRFLARVQAARPGASGDRFRRAFLNGVRYLLDAQFPNGGWPQVYPLQGGYHDAITFNDGAVTQVAMLLADVGARRGDMRFVPAALARSATAAVARAGQLVLRAQVVVDGRGTIWGQQHDALTLRPVGARNFEPAALSSDESVDLVKFLQKHVPGSRAAAMQAIGWLEAHMLRDVAWRAGANGRELVPAPGGRPLWSRYYALETGTPIFGDRDRTIHDDVNALSRERRDGYSWFTWRPCRLVRSCREPAVAGRFVHRRSGRDG